MHGHTRVLGISLLLALYMDSWQVAFVRLSSHQQPGQVLTRLSATWGYCAGVLAGSGELQACPGAIHPPACRRRRV